MRPKALKDDARGVKQIVSPVTTADFVAFATAALDKLDELFPRLSEAKTRREATAVCKLVTGEGTEVLNRLLEERKNKPLEPAHGQIEAFAKTLFKHATPENYVSSRAFYDDKSNRSFRITPTRMTGGVDFLIEVAEDDARRAAQFPTVPIVYCPPIATFTNKYHAREEDLAEGLALSVECDEHAQEARVKMEELLGSATVVVRSGGVWMNGGGEPEPKLHLHYRLGTPARGKDELELLKLARQLAATIVGGDPSNVPINHPIRWPGSWHRKGEPRFCLIDTINPDREIDLATALKALIAAVDPDCKKGIPLKEAAKAAIKKASPSRNQQADNIADAYINQATNSGSKYPQLNAMALQHLELWVPEIFSEAKPYHGGYRVSSKDLGRDDKFSEDLSLSPEGIKDFALHDGLDKDGRPIPPDPLEGKRTPIDIVMEHVFNVPIEKIANAKINNLHLKEFSKAVKWLCEKLDYKLEEDDEEEEKGNKHITEINKRYALVIVGDKIVVLNTDEIKLMTVGSFELWFGNKYVGESSLGKYWTHHKQRRQYEGIEFAPGREVPNRFNLWRGFAVEPKPGDCSKFLAHLRDNVCTGNAALYNWVVGWFAQIMQHPEQKMGTSLALRGKQGTGKTKIGEVMGSLLGDHYALVSDPRYVTGRFNSHLVSCLLLHCDEAFWAGDQAATGKLRDLITGQTNWIEFKGKEAIKVRNYVRLFVTGNSDWLVPAAFEERRFATLDVGEGHMKDGPYFAAIDEEMDNGGREALLHYLLHFDLESVDLRTIPNTAALFDQKMSSLDPTQGWWLDMLNRGELPQIGEEGASPGTCFVSSLFDMYISHASKQGVRRRALETQIGIFLNKHVPGLRRREQKVRQNKKLISLGYVYDFPPLAKCREVFAQALQQKIEWPEKSTWAEAHTDQFGRY